MLKIPCRNVRYFFYICGELKRVNMKNKALTNNSKNRKLRYIRFKNKLRQGKVVIEFAKISDLIWGDLKQSGIVMNEIMLQRKEVLERSFNLKFTCVDTDTRIMGNDFANDIRTYFMHFKAA